MDKIVSTVSSPNIAFVKYWGKKANLAKTPLNDNISMTLSTDILKTETTIYLSSELRQDIFILGGKQTEDKKMSEALTLYRKRFGNKWPENVKILILSKNNFPTSAGIASSASGYSALATAFAELFDIKEVKEKSILARLGSGSACRSVIGGYVKWKQGQSDDGEDSYAVQIAPKSHWPELVDVLAIVSKKEKKIGSRAGMKQTVKTSVLYPERVKYVNEIRIQKVGDAIKNKDFETLAMEIMKDSNSLHSVMLDTWPPIFYMNDVSRQIIYAIQDYNEKQKDIKAAYTFDAGPNAHIITTEQYMKEVKQMLMEINGVQEVLIVPVGDGPKVIAPEKEIVEKYLDKAR